VTGDKFFLHIFFLDNIYRKNKGAVFIYTYIYSRRRFGFREKKLNSKTGNQSKFGRIGEGYTRGQTVTLF
jgi:hypothetical protein